MQPGKFPTFVVPAVSALLAALGVLCAFVPGGVLGVVLAVLLVTVGLSGVLLWWKVLRNPEVMVAKLLERRDLLKDKVAAPDTSSLSDKDVQQAIDKATEMLGGNRAARRAAEAAAKKAVSQPRPAQTRTSKRVTPKKTRPGS